MDLIDILDTIEADSDVDSASVAHYFTEDEIDDLTETVYDMLYDLLNDHHHIILQPNYYDILFHELWDNIHPPFDEDHHDTLNELLHDLMDTYFDTHYPSRELPHYVDDNDDNETKQRLIARYTKLKAKPQYEQGTPQWLNQSNTMITAHQAYKAFGSDALLNQLICEKCTVKTYDDRQQVSETSPLHWGHKYEPVSVMVYEMLYQTKVDRSFGRIQHEQYDFIGASPDGINCLESSPLFGRLLEIKNIVNREIDGVPKVEYWIQMQQQMDVCDLSEECDFLETRFVEYNPEALITVNADNTTKDTAKDNTDNAEDKDSGDDDNDEDNQKPKEELKGLMAQYKDSSGFRYLYCPLTNLDVNTWKAEHESKSDFVRFIYWKLAEISLVVVPRNRIWFAIAVERMKEVWDIILKERETGFQHRMPKRVVKPAITTGSGYQPISSMFGQGCLISLTKSGEDPDMF